MIDTHAHILPVLDDGAKNISEALKFIRLAESEGVTTIIATPHANDGVFNCTKDQVLSAWSELNLLLEAQGVKTRVLPGAEVRVTHDLVDEYDQGNLLTLNNANTHLLIELPGMFMTPAICLMIRQLKERGVTPIIAHAERNPMILNAPRLVKEFIFHGAVVQITAGSLMGDFGRDSMKAAKQWVADGQVFCLGSDIHPGRKYRMADAKKRVIKIAGKKKGMTLLHENPETVLEENGFFDTSLYMKKKYWF